MKKLITIFILGAMLLFSMGYYVVYRFNLRHIKQQMRIAIRQGEFKTGELVQFNFNVSDLNSIKDLEIKEQGKEIRYKGKMYDVVSVRFNGTNLVISCLADENESAVVAGFTRFMDDNSNSWGKKAWSTLKYSFPVFTIPPVTVVNRTPHQARAGYPSYHAAPIPIRFLHKPSPPPWYA